MKKYLVLLLFFIQMSFYAQKKEAVKPNSIIFTETSLGIFNYGDKGASIFLEMALFFQKESNVFSFKAKFLGSAPFSIDIEPTKPTLIKETNEYSVSYGKRFFRNTFSYSFLGGISYSKNREILTNKKMSFIGFPFEINFKKIKNKKKPSKILGIIPVGKPTIFGFSTGVKLFGNLSKQSYIGIGLTFGLGYYKNYNE